MGEPEKVLSWQRKQPVQKPQDSCLSLCNYVPKALRMKTVTTLASLRIL